MLQLLEFRIAPAAFLVPRLADAGTGSLRDAIGGANDHSHAPRGVFSRLGQCDPSRVHRADGILIRAGDAFVGSAPPRLGDQSNSIPGPGAFVARKIVL
jgi:hypothetical protein